MVGIEPGLLQDRPSGKHRVVVLVQQFDAQARGAHRAYYVAQSMVPFVGNIVGCLGVEVGVGARLFPHPGILVLEVIVLHAKDFISEDVGERVELREVQKAAGLEEIRDHLCPPSYVREPEDRASARIHDVVSVATRSVHGLVDVRVHERGFQSHIRGQPAGRLYGWCREVQARNVGAAAGPAQGVDPEVALEVQQVLATHVADLVYLEGLQALLATLEGGYVVEFSRDVDRDPLVPVGPVRLPPLVAPFTHYSLLSEVLNRYWLDRIRKPESEA